MNTKQIFSAELSQLYPIMQWVRNHLATMGCDQPTLQKIELALEEAVVNVIEHGYQNKPGKIEIGFHRNDGLAEITLKDQGPPFNPLEQSTHFDPLAPLEERDIGGLGIFLYTQYMDEVHYERANDRNVLTFRKLVSRSSRSK